MMYATVEQLERGFRDVSKAEYYKCCDLLEEAAVIIDTYNADASNEAKKLVSCRMVRRVLGADAQATPLFPMGASQGSASALGYSQTWTMSGGAVGELYLSKLEKRLLGLGDRIGAGSPVEGLCDDPGN